MTDKDSYSSSLSRDASDDNSQACSEELPFIPLDSRPQRKERNYILVLCLLELIQLVVFGLAFGLRKPTEGCHKQWPDVNGCK